MELKDFKFANKNGKLFAKLHGKQNRTKSENAIHAELSAELTTAGIDPDEYFKHLLSAPPAPAPPADQKKTTDPISGAVTKLEKTKLAYIAYIREIGTERFGKVLDKLTRQKVRLVEDITDAESEDEAVRNFAFIDEKNKELDNLEWQISIVSDVINPTTKTARQIEIFDLLEQGKLIIYGLSTVNQSNQKLLTPLKWGFGLGETFPSTGLTEFGTIFTDVADKIAALNETEKVAATEAAVAELLKKLPAGKGGKMVAQFQLAQLSLAAHMAGIEAHPEWVKMVEAAKAAETSLIGETATTRKMFFAQADKVVGLFGGLKGSEIAKIVGDVIAKNQEMDIAYWKDLYESGLMKVNEDTKNLRTKYGVREVVAVAPKPQRQSGRSTTTGIVKEGNLRAEANKEVVTKTFNIKKNGVLIGTFTTSKGEGARDTNDAYRNWILNEIKKSNITVDFSKFSAKSKWMQETIRLVGGKPTRVALPKLTIVNGIIGKSEKVTPGIRLNCYKPGEKPETIVNSSGKTIPVNQLAIPEGVTYVPSLEPSSPNDNGNNGGSWHAILNGELLYCSVDNSDYNGIAKVLEKLGEKPGDAIVALNELNIGTYSIEFSK